MDNSSTVKKTRTKVVHKNVYQDYKRSEDLEL